MADKWEKVDGGTWGAYRKKKDYSGAIWAVICIVVLLAFAVSDGKAREAAQPVEYRPAAQEATLSQ